MRSWHPVTQVIVFRGLPKAIVRATITGLASILLLVSCGKLERDRRAIDLTGGDPGSGNAAIAHYGCGSCHTIPGVTGANGQAGPSLASLRQRTYIAGELPNSTDNLMRWVQHPLSIHQKTAMPELGVTAKDARDIAAFLYSLK